MHHFAICTPLVRKSRHSHLRILILLTTLAHYAARCLPALPWHGAARVTVFRLVAATAVAVCAPHLALAQGLGGVDGGSGPNRLEPDNFRELSGPVADLSDNPIVVAVEVKGNSSIAAPRVKAMTKTREGRPFDPMQVETDVRKLASIGMFADVKTYTREVPGGIVVIFEVLERPTINYIKILGNKSVRELVLLKQIGIAEGDSLNYYAVEDARRSLEDFYRERGFAKAQVTIAEGDKPSHKGVVLVVHEGKMARIWKTTFVGNELTSDARLKTQIQSKPGVFYYLGGKVDRNKIDEDVDRLTSYYRSLGYFRARVGRELEYNDDGSWLKLTFVIDEGPRYNVRTVRFEGHEVFDEPTLAADLELKQGEPFQLAKLNRDVALLRDRYGSQGYIFADVKADPRFLEEPGQLDLVYQIKEGGQYRVGNINVVVNGNHPHTKQEVVLNRRGNLQPGDIIDIREIRGWERRLKSSQLFANDPARGVAPQVVVKPPAPSEMEGIAEGSPNRSRPPMHRGQSPRQSRYWPSWP